MSDERTCHWCLVDLPESEDVVYRGIETESREDLLFLCGRDLHELTANFDDDFNFPLGLG